MNFELFQKLFPRYHEIMVLGKSLEKEGKPYHLIGMTRVDDGAELSVLNMCRPLDSYPAWEEQCELTMRETMKQHEEADDNYFMGIRAFLFNGIEYSVRSASSGCLNPWGDVEALGLFTEMQKAGWRVPEDSVFYQRDWEEIGLTKITIDLEGKELPMLEDNKITVVKNIGTRNVRIEQPVTLFIESEEKETDTAIRQKEEKETDTAIRQKEEKKPDTVLRQSEEKKPGKFDTIIFKKEDGTEAVCYINRVYRMDVWKDQEERFADPDWNKRMREYMSEEELQDLKRQTCEALEQECPKGMYYVGIEYECSEDIALQFYSREYLDSVPTIHEGSATSMIMLLKPDKKTGAHGLKLRGAVIQTPVTGETTEFAAELFCYMVTTPEQEEEISL